MIGKLYGIATGPGDPELLTIKAIKALGRADVIAIPAHSGEDRTALAIVQQYVQDKEVLECFFAMSRNVDERVAARKAAAQSIVRYLDAGKTVGFITLGDSTTYSTYMYVHEIVTELGYPAEIIPGVTSFAAAAAALGIALCIGDESLTVIPARHSQDISELLDIPGNKVIMKSSANLVSVLEELKRRGQNNNTYVVSRASMADQRLFRSIDNFLEDPETGYFTIAIVKEG
ncbi:MAG: precorrin-2 C(20)-methyltransferase [Coriobacteriia bacterium]|nr:precorrin-2 C(20)-methyltransferase [Coriobacteriia bacterium]